MLPARGEDLAVEYNFKYITFKNGFMNKKNQIYIVNCCNMFSFLKQVFVKLDLKWEDSFCLTPPSKCMMSAKSTLVVIGMKSLYEYV